MGLWCLTNMLSGISEWISRDLFIFLGFLLFFKICHFFIFSQKLKFINTLTEDDSFGLPPILSPQILIIDFQPT